MTLKESFSVRKLAIHVGSRFIATVLFLLTFLLIAPLSAHACVALISGDGRPVIASERAVIIWDDEHKVEHFIREAHINTDASEVGFIVPTPTTPELVEADPQIFQMAENVAKPNGIPYVVQNPPLLIVRAVAAGPALLALESRSQSPVFASVDSPTPTDSTPAPPPLPAGPALKEQIVGAYRAVTIAADDTATLTAWLKANGYTWNKASEDWLKPYAAKKWKITAFKFINQNNYSVTTDAIRMTFPSDRPFYPYSEPGAGSKDQKPNPFGRSLSVAVLSNARMSGVLADGHAWPAVLRFAGPTTPQNDEAKIWTESQWLDLTKLNDPKYGFTLPKWLSFFRDDSNPRPGTADLYFSPDANQSAVRVTDVDYKLPMRQTLDLSHPWADLATLLILIFVPGGAIYCGMRVLRRPLLLEGKTPPPTSKSICIRDRIFGSVTAFYGAFNLLSYGGLLAAIYVSLWGSFPEGDWVFMILSTLLATLICLLLMTLSLALIYCGSSLSFFSQRMAARTSKSLKRGRQMGRCAIAFGILFVLAVALLLGIILSGDGRADFFS